MKTKSRNLTLELMRNKRELIEARKELDLMRKKSQEMESLVSLIQRSWSQIDIDSSLLLDSLGDSEMKLPDEGDSELLYKLLNASSRWLTLDPTNTENVSTLDIDQWNSNGDIEKAKEKALQAEVDLKLAVKSPHEGGTDAGSRLLVSEQVEQHLQGHTSFTMSLLERLCSTLNEITDVGSREEILRPLSQARENSSIILTLQDNVLKLRSEIIETKALLQLKENEKVKLEKKLDKALMTVKELEERSGAVRNAANESKEGTTDSTSSAVPSGETVTSSESAAAIGITKAKGDNGSNGDQAYEKELQLQIELLEKQLAESESAKAKVERQMTEKLARPFAQTETQVSDMRKTLEELKNQFKHRLAEYVKQVRERHPPLCQLCVSYCCLASCCGALVDRRSDERTRRLSLHRHEIRSSHGAKGGTSCSCHRARNRPHQSGENSLGNTYLRHASQCGSCSTIENASTRMATSRCGSAIAYSAS